jgi:putative ABC transport system permease protein
MNQVALIFKLFRRGAEVQRKRMAMTVAAIAWGTLSIVLLLSFGEGMKRAFTAGSRGLGEGIVVVWPGATSIAYQGFPQGRDLSFVPDDVDLVTASIPAIGASSAEMRRWGNSVTYGRQSLTKPVVGVEPSYGALRNQIPMAGGRFLNDRDENAKRRVVFLGNDLADELFAKEAPIGRTILINQVPFQVVGVMQKKIQMGTYGGPDANNAVIPLSTFRALFGRTHLSNMVVKAKSPELNKAMQKELYAVLGAKYRFDPKDERALAMWDTEKSQQMTRNISIGIQMFLGVIGALTLLIGGVGVANIMYAVVKHRTKEIGVQMALGARRSYILGPLVLESLSLTALGGLIGVGAGWGLVQLLAFALTQAKSEALTLLGSPTFSPAIAATTVLLLGAIGFLAGYFPSRRAVAIQPAVALRYE